jgi:hypothetical protein
MENNYVGDYEDLKFHNERDFLKSTKKYQCAKNSWSRPNNIKTSRKTSRCVIRSELNYFKNNYDILLDYIIHYPKHVSRVNSFCHCCNMVVRGRGKD